MICSKCGKENLSNTNFCTGCGNPMISAQSLSNVNNNNIPTGTVMNSNNILDQSVNTNNQMVNNNLHQNNTNMNYFKFIIDSIIKPVKTYKEENKKLQEPKNSIVLALITSLLITILSLISTFFSTVIDKNIFTDKIEFSFDSLEYVEWGEVLGQTFLGSLIVIFALAAIYYIGSLIAKKQTNYLKLVGITSISIIPLILCSNVLSPIISLIYSPLGMLITIVGSAYSILVFVSVVNEEINFSEKDYSIYYHLACFMSIIIIFYIIITYVLSDYISMYSILG